MEPNEEQTPNQKTGTPDIVSPSAKKPSFWRTLMNKDTRFGRFNRALLRWLAIVLSLFLLGLLAAYFMLVRPLQLQNDQYRASLAEADTTSQRLEQINQTKSDLETQIADLQAAAVSDAEHIQFLKAVGKLQDARLAYALEDKTAARNLLLETRTILVKLSPTLNRGEQGLSNQLQARLDLALAELANDPELATADLGVLYDSMQAAEGKLFPAK